MSGDKPDYKSASRALAGVKEANDTRLENEAEAERKREQEEKRAAQAARAKDRATWPEEGTTSVHSHVVVRRVIGGKTQVGVGIGGARGVREGWTAHLKLKDGGTLDTPVVDVVHDLSYIELPSAEIAEKINGDVELRPKAR